MVLCGDAFIEQLNAKWRQQPHPTDVLSFPLFEPPEAPPPGAPLGDIVIDIEYAEGLVAQKTHRVRVAQELGLDDPEELEWGLVEEVEFLFIHGLLHLVGHDHAEPDEEARMKAQERRLWEAAAPARGLQG